MADRNIVMTGANSIGATLFPGLLTRSILDVAAADGKTFVDLASALASYQLSVSLRYLNCHAARHHRQGAPPSSISPALPIQP
ncbi:hypothetical protein FOMG_18694 [Fusarium oxysporum f. sp. melonis 26406]|uniref:Uncharacterized protein n=1 Tax=Fusarium oxysporum f. sp. melonis 26406 TaxID=1089452 RepID=W9Z7M4_FUSOX|nr:hypothetical protein FOMG_18694 [Fusarium oxysporum f. sp. melonis 26406]